MATALSGGTNDNSFVRPDQYNREANYAPSSFDRRQILAVNYVYSLPKLEKGNAFTKLITNGWQLSGVTVLQSGPFLTPYQQSVDPANTNILTTVGQARPDQLANVSLYAPHRTTAQWLNPAAVPYLNLQNSSGTGIGRFGNAPVGGVVGPGTANFSLSLSKAFGLTEKAKIQFSMEAANIFNHRNYEPPDMQLDSGGFGAISALQTAEGAGPRSLEVAGRITF